MSPQHSSSQHTVMRAPESTNPHHDPDSEPTTTAPLTTHPMPDPAPGRRTRWPMRAVAAAGVITGLAAAAAGIIVSAGGTEPVVDGLVLLGFAAGWALLLALSVLCTDHPQRWAAVPATVLGVGGAALVVFTPSSTTMDDLGWVWPPALLVLLVWISTRIRRQLPRRGGRWMLYPVIAVTAIAAIGGGIHTVSQSINQASAGTPPGQLIDVAITSCSCPAPDPVGPR